MGSVAGCGGGKKAGDASTSSTAPPPLSNSDFEARRNAPGVVRSFDFTSLGDDVTGSPVNAYPNVGWYPGSSNNPMLDASHGLSAVRFDVPGKSGSNAGGEWYVNFSTDLSVRFGAGQTFFMQWRQRFNDAYIANLILQGAPNSGFPTSIKQVIVSTGDTGPPLIHWDSCTLLELVCTNYNEHAFPYLYQGCGYYEPLIDKQPGDSNDFRLQNQRPAPFCLYSQSKGLNTAVPVGCFGYFADEWMTWQISITVGRRDPTLDKFVGSRVRLWGAREGQSSQLLIDIPCDIHCGPATEDQQYGKAWFGPYMTSKDVMQDHSLIQTWVAEFIVSRNPIKDPIVQTIPPQGPGPLATLPPGKIRSLGAWGDGSRLDNGHAEYGKLTYDPPNKRMLLFGGGHTIPNGADDVIALPCMTMATPMYSVFPRTSDADMALPNNIDTDLNQWRTTRHLRATHTFGASIVFNNRFYVLTTGGAGTHSLAYLDLATNTWTWLGLQPPWYYVAYVCLDPVSQKIVVVSSTPSFSPFFWIYDPVANTITPGTALPSYNVTVPPDIFYYAPTDSFILIQVTGVVLELTLDRTTPANSTTVTVSTTGTPPLLKQPGVNNYPSKWDWDPNNGVYSGFFQHGKVYNYNPVTHLWTEETITFEDGSSASSILQTESSLAFDPDSGCFIFLQDNSSAYAYRV